MQKADNSVNKFRVAIELVSVTSSDGTGNKSNLQDQDSVSREKNQT